MSGDTKEKPARIGIPEATRLFAREGCIISDETVRRMAHSGKLDAVRVGRQIFIDPASVLAITAGTTKDT